MMYACQEIMGVPRHKDRTFLTTIGDFYRAKNPNTFIDYCLIETDHKDWDGQNKYISDARYENELDSGRAHGFTCIRINASDTNRQARRPNESIVDLHSSENGCSDDYEFDYVINNDASLLELHEKLDDIVTDILKKEKQRASI